MNPSAPRIYNHVMGWLLPAVAGLTPLAIIYALLRPNVGQAYFFQAATLAATFGLGLAWALGWRALPGRPNFLAWLLLLNGAALLLSFSGSQSWPFSLKQALLPVCGFVFFGLLIAQPERRRLLARLRAVLVAEAALLALYGIMQHFGIEILQFGPHVEKNRVIGTIGHPNFLASVLGPLLLVVLGLAMTRRALAGRLAAAALCALLALCIALAQTRGMWLGLALGVAAGAWVGSRYCTRHGVSRRWLANLGLGSVIVAAVLGLMIFRVLPGFGRSVDVEQRVTSQSEVKSRMFYWRAAIDMALKRPVFGQGYAMFDPKFWDYALQQQKSPLGPYYYDVLPSIAGVSPGHVHNEYLEVLAEEGFAGFAALAALLGFFLFFGYWAIMRLEEPGRALEGAMVYGALITILVDAAFSFPWRLPVSLIVWMMVLAWLYDLIYPQPASNA